MFFHDPMVAAHAFCVVNATAAKTKNSDKIAFRMFLRLLLLLLSIELPLAKIQCLLLFTAFLLFFAVLYSSFLFFISLFCSLQPQS